MASSHSESDGALKSIDTTILRLQKLFSTPTGIDVSLSTTYYTLRFLHSRLLHQLEKQYEQLAVDFANNASPVMLPGETMVASIPAPRTRLSEACTTVKTAAGAISDFRAFTRLWGLLGVYSWARGTYLHPPRDRVLKAIVWTQIIAGFWYQALENAAYLVSKGVLRGDKWSEREGRYYRLSSGFWLVHIVLEALRMLRAKQIESETKLGKLDEREAKKVERQWQMDFYRNASWAPLAWHWSLLEEHSPLTETWIGVFGMFPGIVRLRGLWAATA